MSRGSHAFWALAAVILAAGLAACGGEPRRTPVRELVTPTVSQPAGPARVTDPDRARYVREVDRVCDRYNPQRDDAVSEAEKAPDVDTAVAAYDDSIALADQQLRGIEAIAPPDADRALIERNVVDRLRERLDLRRALREDLRESDAAGAQRHRAQLDALTIALQAFARGYGFQVCGAH
jgi:hypothetical protein